MTQTPSLTSLVAETLSLPERAVAAVIALLDEAATVPFIARYRKEATGGLDEVAVRDIQEKRAYFKELEERKEAVIRAIDEQGKLTSGLEARIRACREKARLEDLYAPYKRKRKTKADLAREAGLEPLAERILAQALTGSPEEEAAAFVSAEKGVADVAAALSGARDIIAQGVADDADVRATLRARFETTGVMESTVAPEHEGARTKFEDYYDYREKIATIPPHRFHAIRRGETEGVLRTKIVIDEDEAVAEILRVRKYVPASPFAAELSRACRDSLRRLLGPSVETDVRVELKLSADRQAVQVFAENLRHLLLAAPYGARPVIGIDPGLRTGCKCAAVDATGRYLDDVTIYPFKGAGDLARAERELRAFIERHGPSAIAVGNGTAGRETERFVRDTLKGAGISNIICVLVSESGASIYSASDVAREEFPELDLTVRGAISIARRLQDPLAELVKIDPKSIGVGQYQHDVQETLLKRKLGEVVESAVNAVGVELNTASASLLSYVAGVGPSLAKRIVETRAARGAFESRAALRDVPGFGPRAFEQAAGFLRVRASENPLDASAVHPERYALVQKMAVDLGVPVASIVGSRELVKKIDLAAYKSDDAGELTLKDILAELEKPGRDPRDVFEAPAFRDDVKGLEDLREGMVLEGVVTNVTNFGAFVDVGVKQDGLVHISQLADHFVDDPAKVVKVGQKLVVRVLEVDLVRSRIALSARSSAGAQSEKPGAFKKREGGAPGRPQERRGKRGERPRAEGFSNNPFAALERSKK
jgi:protein Tex